MEKKKKENVEVKQESDADKIRQKKNNFTMAYILVGICIIAILIMLLYAFLVK